MRSYQELFRPGRIGKMEVRNRLVMTAMCTSFNFAGNGYVTDSSRERLWRVSRSGTALC